MFHQLPQLLRMQPSVSLSSPVTNATYLNNVITQGILNLTSSLMGKESQLSPVVPVLCTTQLDPALRNELQDPRIGGLILELANSESEAHSPDIVVCQLCICT